MTAQTTPVLRIPAHCATSALERNALRWLNAAEGYDDGAAGRYRDLAHGGCSSGLVGHLIYSRDCAAFLKRHRAEINTLLGQEMEDSGYASPEFLTDWDKSDPLGLDVNVDRLAWFGFETAAWTVANRAGIET